MIRPEQIPDEVVQAVMRALDLQIRDDLARAAIRAALNAWPGVDTKDGSEYWVPLILILPLPVRPE
jgi:Arc/MetJ family transcription regulator